MSARDSGLSPTLEATLQEVCAEARVPVRRHDELRTLLASPPESWPRCCGASCHPCIDEQADLARTILARARARRHDVDFG